MNPYIDKDLILLKNANRYQEWIYSLIAPYLGKRILEVGAGIGSYTNRLLGREFIVATDISDYYVSQMAKRFANRSEVSTQVFDVCNISEKQKALFISQRFDSIMLINVLEHIEKDLKSLMDLKDFLNTAGRLVIVAPAMQFLYGSLDQAYCHRRRYLRRDFEHMSAPLKMSLEVCRYFNFFGMYGWYMNAKLCKKNYLSRRQVIFFDKLVPLLQRLEKIFLPPAGLSIVAVFKK